MTEPLTALPSTRLIDLFSRDPISWTAEERAEIVEALRAERGRWSQKENDKKMKVPRSPKTKVPRPAKLTLDMLGDLKL